MRYVKALLRIPLQLSASRRLTIVVFAFLGCAGLFAIGFPSPLNGSLLGIPVALTV